MIETGKADVCCPRNVAHRRGVITLVSKDLRRTAKNELELLIVTGKFSGHINDPLYFVLCAFFQHAAIDKACSSESHILKLKRLTFNPRRRWCDPVCDLSRLS